MFDLVFIEQDSFALPKLLDVSVFIGVGSNPARITASHGLEFQERFDVLYKQSALARSRIVLSDRVFVHFVNLQDSVTLRVPGPALVLASGDGATLCQRKYLPSCRTIGFPISATFESKLAVRAVMWSANSGTSRCSCICCYVRTRGTSRKAKTLGL